MDDIELWWEWEAVSRGRRQMGGLKPLLEWAGLGKEATDEEIAAEELGGDDLIVLPADTWRVLGRNALMACELLEAAESGGMLGAACWLEAQGFEWWTPGAGRGDP